MRAVDLILARSRTSKLTQTKGDMLDAYNCSEKETAEKHQNELLDLMLKEDGSVYTPYEFRNEAFTRRRNAFV